MINVWIDLKKKKGRPRIICMERISTDWNKGMSGNRKDVERKKEILIDERIFGFLFLFCFGFFFFFPI